MTSVVTGAGGFIGGHLVKSLLDKGHYVLAVDVKPKERWYQIYDADNRFNVDLKEKDMAQSYIFGDHVYHLAAQMGGMGYIENNKAECMLSSLSDTNVLLAAKENGAKKVFYASSACVYPSYRQETNSPEALKEEYAYPADPEDGYGWQKLFGERMCRHFYEDFGLETRVARYHNVMGIHGTYKGGREKAPAAICRKVAEAVISGKHEIEIWGDGEQSRSFCQVEDCVYGTQLIMNSDVREPLNLGSSRLVTINQMVDIVENIAGVKLKRIYNLDAPKGVRGRNSDNTKIKQTLGWEPSVTLEKGLEDVYRWVYNLIS